MPLSKGHPLYRYRITPEEDDSSITFRAHGMRLDAERELLVFVLYAEDGTTLTESERIVATYPFSTHRVERLPHGDLSPRRREIVWPDRDLERIHRRRTSDGDDMPLPEPADFLT